MPPRLFPAGNTVRLTGMEGEEGGPRLQLLLLVGPGPASTWWMDLLADGARPGLHGWMHEDDLRVVWPHLHVRPTVTPSFLVFLDGWPVDWFPAPLDPTTQLDRVLASATDRYAFCSTQAAHVRPRTTTVR